MKNMIRVFLPLIAILLFVRFYFSNLPVMKPAGNYPVWLKDSAGNQTRQTSGLCFTGSDGNVKRFISCDDIGVVNRLEIDESGTEPRVRIYPVEYSQQIRDLFAKFKKTDMEEIMFDPHNNRILLSIEGHEYSSNDPMIYRQKEGIYELTFNKDISSFDTLLTIKRLALPEEIYKFTFDNIGFEGFSATKDFFYIGLENYQKDNEQFTDSTFLYVVNRRSGSVRTISTKEHEVSSISGLYAADDRTLYGIDRNRRIMFMLKFDDDHNIVSSERKALELGVPGFRDMTNIPGIAPESVTMDDRGSFYIAIDPWLAFYRPDLAQRKLLGEEAEFNFKKEIPIMYKFNNEF